MNFRNIYKVRWTCQYANIASPYLQPSLKLCSLSHPLRNENFIRHLNVIRCKLKYVMWAICIIKPRNYSLWNKIIPCMFKRRLNVIVKCNPNYVLLPICIVWWWNNSIHIRVCLKCYHFENCCFFQCKVYRGIKTHVPKLLSSSL